MSEIMKGLPSEQCATVLVRNPIMKARWPLGESHSTVRWEACQQKLQSQIHRRAFHHCHPNQYLDRLPFPPLSHRMRALSTHTAAGQATQKDHAAPPSCPASAGRPAPASSAGAATLPRSRRCCGAGCCPVHARRCCPAAPAPRLRVPGSAPMAEPGGARRLGPAIRLHQP